MKILIVIIVVILCIVVCFYSLGKFINLMFYYKFESTGYPVLDGLIAFLFACSVFILIFIFYGIGHELIRIVNDYNLI